MINGNLNRKLLKWLKITTTGNSYIILSNLVFSVLKARVNSGLLIKLFFRQIQYVGQASQIIDRSES